MRLPRVEDFEKLCECYTMFDKDLKGWWFYDKGTGEELFLPCNGYRDGDTVKNAGLCGNYWSSAYVSSGTAYSLYFDNISVYPSHFSGSCLGLSVRLVSDEPFDGGAIHVAGLYWKPENEEGYYTYDDAMEKFNK